VNTDTVGLEVRGVGALAAEIVERAAALVAVLARQAGEGADAAQAMRMAARASALSALNAQAFARASSELDASIGGRGDEFALTQALAQSVEVPLGICDVATDVVLLARVLAEGPLSDRSADLCGVAQLAAAACGTAALLVRVNLAMAPDDPRRSRADMVSTTAEHAARRMREELVET
jgi:hypothetical protein